MARQREEWPEWEDMQALIVDLPEDEPVEEVQRIFDELEDQGLAFSGRSLFKLRRLDAAAQRTVAQQMLYYYKDPRGPSNVLSDLCQIMLERPPRTSRSQPSNAQGPSSVLTAQGDSHSGGGGQGARGSTEAWGHEFPLGQWHDPSIWPPFPEQYFNRVGNAHLRWGKKAAGVGSSWMRAVKSLTKAQLLRLGFANEFVFGHDYVLPLFRSWCEDRCLRPLLDFLGVEELMLPFRHRWNASNGEQFQRMHCLKFQYRAATDPCARRQINDFHSDSDYDSSASTEGEPMTSTEGEPMTLWHGTYTCCAARVLQTHKFVMSQPQSNATGYGAQGSLGHESHWCEEAVYTAKTANQAVEYSFSANMFGDGLMYGFLFELEGDRRYIVKQFNSRGPGCGEVLMHADGIKIRNVYFIFNMDVPAGASRRVNCGVNRDPLELLPEGLLTRPFVAPVPLRCENCLWGNHMWCTKC